MQGKDKNMTRREFITRSAGTIGMLALISSPFAVLNKEKAQQKASNTPSIPQGKKTNRAWCMVIDLRKCDGCVTIDMPPQCTQACIDGHFVPQGQQWIQVYQVELPGGGTGPMPTPCMQCENAPCVNVCPVGATYQTKEGVVLVDHYRCIGCRFCMAACPYQRRFFNWGTPRIPPEAALAEYSPEYPVPAVKGTVIKCMFCAHFLHDGKLPYCVKGCPMKALYIGDLSENVATNGNEVMELSRFIRENDAFRYKEELGTQPRVWYIPGHGQAVGRKAADTRTLKPLIWKTEGYDNHIALDWPLAGEHK